MKVPIVCVNLRRRGTILYTGWGDEREEKRYTHGLVAIFTAWGLSTEINRPVAG